MSATIRVATPEDAGAILTIYAPIVRETAISFEVEPPTLVEMHERIATTLRSTQGYRSYGGEEDVPVIHRSIRGCHDKRRRLNGHHNPR
jgi:L-amino acid N-acyltransferase YncA